jgi:hypothetical protein
VGGSPPSNLTSTNNNVTTESVNVNLTTQYYGTQSLFRYLSGNPTITITSSAYTFNNNNVYPLTPFSTTQSRYEYSQFTYISQPYAVMSFRFEPPRFGTLPGVDTLYFWIPNASQTGATYKIYDSLNVYMGDLTEYKNSDVDNTIPSNIYTSTINLGSGSSARDFYIQNFSLVCVHEDTNVLTNDGYKKIKDIRSGDVVYDENNDSHVVVNNIKLNITNEFIMIGKGSIGENKPMNDLLIKDGHPVLIDGEEIDCQLLVNGTTIKRVETYEKKYIYTLATEKRVFVNMENVHVCTWNIDQWKSYDNINKIPHILL